MPEDIAIVVLAAGKGTRMASPLPKVLHPVAGLPMVAHVLTAAAALKPHHTVLVVGQDMAEVEKEVRRIHPAVKFAVQSKQRGTGDAVSRALPLLKDFHGIVLVVYGDTPLIRSVTLRAVVERANVKDGPAVVVLGFDARDPGCYGRLISGTGGELEAIVEYKDATEAQRAVMRCNAGIMALRSDALHLLDAIGDRNAQKERYLTDVVAMARGKGLSVRVVMTEEREVTGVNTQEERAVAECLKQEELRAALMKRGVTLVAPETVFLSADTDVAAGAVIHPYVVFGPGVKVGARAEIKSFSHLEGATVGERAVVGPFARLRPGVTLGAEAKIGNFVEIKNSAIAERAKVSHLSYVGDAKIGRNSNIGAGTITCNYDGFAKHKTTIGEDVFIGSHTTIIAPLTVGDGAVVGAGTTLLDDVEANALAINEKKQKNTREGGASYRRKRRKSDAGGE